MSAAQFLDGPASLRIVGSCREAPHYFSIILNVTVGKLPYRNSGCRKDPPDFSVILSVTTGKLP
jgi:hypothetical protein